MEREEIGALAPTQICVGWWEVELRAARLRTRPWLERAALVERKVLPVVRTSEGCARLLDGHHFVLALATSGWIDRVRVETVADLRGNRHPLLEMHRRGWLHLQLRGAETAGLGALPAHLIDCPDDPHRSLAWALRKAGGFGKSPHPFAEFAWADHLRSAVPLDPGAPVTAGALRRSQQLAHRNEARHLPGWLAAPQASPDEPIRRTTRRRAA